MESGEASFDEESTAMSTAPAAQKSEPGLEAVVEKHQPQPAKDETNSRLWQFATLLVPILLTTGLTYWVSQKQDSIKQELDKQSQMFSQQLELSEELYKRRFDTYEKLYAELVQLNARLTTAAGADPAQWSKANADQVIQFNQMLDLSRLHMSPKVADLTADAWQAGAQGDGTQLTQTIKDMETAMKYELDEWLVARKEVLPAAVAPGKPKKSKVKTGSSQ